MTVKFSELGLKVESHWPFYIRDYPVRADGHPLMFTKTSRFTARDEYDRNWNFFPCLDISVVAVRPGEQILASCAKVRKGGA